MNGGRDIFRPHSKEWDNMRIGLVGDLHGLPIPSSLYRNIDISEPDILIQVGDIWDACTVAFPVPFFYITGNHEKSQLSPIPRTNHRLNSGLNDIDGLKVVALNTTPVPGAALGPARYKEEDYLACLEIQKPDIFVSHGCGYPFLVFVGGKMRNVEDLRLTELISKTCPKYAISGHNHQFHIDEQNHTVLVRLGTERTGLYHLIEL